MSDSLSFHARRYDTGDCIECIVADGHIQSIAPSSRGAGELPLIAPGLFDLQINGYGGIWFSDEQLTVEQVLTVLDKLPQHGISRVCPTLITNSSEALEHGFAILRSACEKEAWADELVAGYHLEGPFIATEDGPRGAHPLEHVRPCDWDAFCRWQEASGGRIRLVTLAPESPGAVEFIKAAVKTGVRIAIGHTAANSEQVAAAVDAGASLSTHLGNGAHGMLRRHPNYIWDQLADDRLTASLIVDGHHLPQNVVRAFVKAKGLDNVLLTCDASGLAGCPPGEYVYHGHDFEILDDGRIVVAGQRQYLAGSGALTDECVACAVDMVPLPLPTAIDLAALKPAELLGCERASLCEGDRADLMLFRWSGPGSPLEIETTVSAGSVRYDNSATTA